MINPVCEEIILEQKVLNAAAGGIQHLVIADLNGWRAIWSAKSKTIRCRRFEREITKAAARLERWLS
jgi:hypothetical protein